MSLSYDFALFYPKDIVWNVLKAFSKIAMPGKIMFPYYPVQIYNTKTNESIEFPCSIEKEENSLSFSPDSESALEFKTVLSFEIDDAIIEYFETLKSSFFRQYQQDKEEIRRRDKGTMITSSNLENYQYYEKKCQSLYNQQNIDLEYITLEIIVGTNIGLITLKPVGTTMSICFAKSTSINDKLAEFLQEYDGICGFLDKEDKGGVLFWRKEELLPLLQLALHEKNADIVYFVSHLCGYIGEQAIPLLPDLISLTRSEDSDIRLGVLLGFRELQPETKPAILAVIELLIDESGLGSLARDILLELGETAVPYLISALNDKRKEIKWEVIETLGEMGDKAISALPALKNLLGDPECKNAVYKAIDKISRK